MTPCYTGFTLNTAVVWCDGSGAAFDLRTPAFSFPPYVFSVIKTKTGNAGCRAR